MYVVNGISFRSKKDVEQHARNIRDKYARLLGGHYLNGDDADFMLSLLAMHPDAIDKIGCGVSRMWVQVNREPRVSFGFWLERTDGTQTDFSFLACCRKVTNRQEILHAMRHEVDADVQRFKDNFFATTNRTCPVTGAAITPSDSDIHHQPPNTFAVIANRFLAATRGGFGDSVQRRWANAIAFCK